ncbi:putative membrane-bound metal-dependent hydrolase [Escherichia coli]|uniref:Putative membrane-bound metal-dependent hydrolase n=1 Tax=Escherichia coli TaxID=562 RepID=A0A2X1N2W3_ECOLX|nr:putative membrane-bound metal-dependent hydrolase [Escherichia coli]
MPTVITHAAVPYALVRVGFESHPSALLFAGIILAMLPDATSCRLILALLTAMFLVIAGLPIRWCLRLLSAVMCADWTSMVQGWADSLLAVFNRLVAIAQLAGFGNHWR